MKIEFERAMRALPLVAILRGITPQEVERVGDALVESGFRLIEVPLTSPGAFESIGRLVARFGRELIVGAGTLRRVSELDELVSVGGRLMVTPHADTVLIRAAAKRGLITLPGVATPTEAFAALEAGATGLKLFPAEIIPPRVVAAFRTVLGPDVALCPTGGVQPGDLASYISSGANGFGLGGALYRPGDAAAEVAAHARAFADAWTARMSPAAGERG